MSSSEGLSPEMTHTNRLINAKSPYLLQHANNPVDWYEWGDEAFQKARSENKPVFLSVGYSACHWCHVLAHESFEDKVTAKLMNEHYVNIKVDREERPDVDRLYMMFLQATSGGGGWPMSVWLTPELHPFFAGTYFPPGQFRQVLAKLADTWEADPARCIAAGQQIIAELQRVSAVAPQDIALAPHALAQSVFARLEKQFDSEHGGFGSAPKFPNPARTISFLTRYAALGLSGDGAGQRRADAEAARDMAVRTMVQIYKGGIHDFVGGGFARYSVDERWHVPHFEKMLYDQAQLLTSALELSQLVPPSDRAHDTLRSMAADIVGYVSARLTSPAGGFYSAEDADSLPHADSPAKKEGAFYVWTARELEEVLGPEDAAVFGWAFGVEAQGNCDPRHDVQGELAGQNVLFVAHDEAETAARFGRTVEDVRGVLRGSLGRLRAHREEHRPRPYLDDKILTCWNGLMISGLAKAAEVLGDGAALRLAEQAAAFVRAKLYDSVTGELRRSFREGPGPRGQADDYAFLIQGLLDLYEASAKEEYVLWAVRLQETLDGLFYDEQEGGYFASAPDAHILVRMKDAQDGAEPSAVSVTVGNLQRLGHFAEDRHVRYEEKRRGTIAAHGQLLSSAPFALAGMVGALLVGEHGYKQLIVTDVDNAASKHLALIRRVFVPNRVLIYVDPGHPPRGLAGMNATLRSLIGEGDARACVRVCENYSCGLPIEDAEELQSILPRYF